MTFGTTNDFSLFFVILIFSDVWGDFVYATPPVGCIVSSVIGCIVASSHTEAGLLPKTLGLNK